uniref:Uncharacterized protein n=1 Tax=Romanomermis culicivorax TaxID=13658 RepID=A0A915HNG7_ROMCU
MRIGAVVDPILHFRPMNSSQNHHSRQLVYEFLFENLIPRIVDNWSLRLEILEMADRQLLIEVLGDRFLGPFLDSKIEFFFVCEKVDFAFYDGMISNNDNDLESGKSSTLIGFCAAIFDQSESSRRCFLSKMKLKYEMEYKSRRLENSFDPTMQDQKFNFLLKFLVESFDIEDESDLLTSFRSDSSSNLAIHHPQCPQIFKSWLSSSNYHNVPDYVSKNYQSYVKLMFSPEMCQTLAPKRTLMATLAALKKMGIIFDYVSKMKMTQI